jgi:3-isopropylmalate/(R)-2-methylmalate dehydratase large subunit
MAQASQNKPETLFDKIWRRHVIHQQPDGPALLYVDRNIVHDGTFHAFEMLRARHLPILRPGQTFGTPDHYVATRGANAQQAPEVSRMVDLFARNMEGSGIHVFPRGDRRQGIVHVVGPEQGITLPGLFMVCGDSHTSTHGGLGAFAFGIGQSENAHVLATQTLWQDRPQRMRITVDGSLGQGVSSKDVILAIIGKIGASGAVGYVVEYAGSTMRGFSVEQRLTVCNMSIEAGAKAGLIAPDDIVYQYLHDRPFAPKDAKWDRAVADWRSLPSDEGATFDREVSLDAATIAPMVTWGTTPEDVLPITGTIPDPAKEPDAGKREHIVAALDYMGLQAGRKLSDTPIDIVFIGSCTNGRIEDLRIAAKILKSTKVSIPTVIVPGSGLVKAQAEAEGLDAIFRAAGAEWREPGCSMCVGMNGDTVAKGQRSASTSNRNFIGRQGAGARTHLVSPAMAAAAAIAGRLTDVRKLPQGREAA